MIQSLLTMNRWKVPEAAAVIKATAESNKAKGVQTVANPPFAENSIGGREDSFGRW